VSQQSDSDMRVPFVSGSGRFGAMVIVPCSMATLGRIASGSGDSVLLRAADVFLKERRKLIVVPRETPWNLIHARNIVTLLEAGAVVLQPFHLFTAVQRHLSMLSTLWSGGFSIKSVCRARAPIAGPIKLHVAARARNLEDRRSAGAMADRVWILFAPGLGAHAPLRNRRPGECFGKTSGGKLHCRALA